jgi:hypothetical protein
MMFLELIKLLRIIIYCDIVLFRQDVRRAQQTENYATLQRFYMRCFDTFAEICALFKVSVDLHGRGFNWIRIGTTDRVM